MRLQDDRTDAHRDPQSPEFLPYIVVGTDSFLSGWGQARGGASFAGWACTDADLNACLAMVERRPEMKRVRIVGHDYRPTGKGHCQIYLYRNPPTRQQMADANASEG